MTISKVLYFAALLPPPEVKKEVLKMKMEIKEKFEAAHALKLPAHITLIPPVRLERDQEKEFSKALKAVAQQQAVFPVELKDFGHFGQRVIFINVVQHEPVKELHQRLMASLSGFLPGDKDQNLHPHVTLATRDLKKQKFQQAWNEFENRSYHSNFTADRLTLFRHNGKRWEILEEYPFLKKEH